VLFNYFLRRQFLDVAAHYFSVIAALQKGPPGRPKAAELVRQKRTHALQQTVRSPRWREQEARVGS
jgi:hypothetical protein